MRRFALAVICLIFCVGAVAADEDELLTKKYSSCMDRSGGVTAAMDDCIAAETSVQDAKLNGIYSKLMKALKPARRQQLVEVQRTWIKYRDLNCGFYSDPDGGTAAASAAKGCLLHATARRAHELEQLMPQDK